jgi:dTDP-4-amino-4,6-dideoxygalactose transaminase
LKAHLASREVETEVYYPLPLHLQPCFRHLGFREGDLPEAEQASRQVLALPVHPDLSDAQLDHAARAIEEFYRT